MEGRVAELEQRLESEEGLRREGEEKLSEVQKALAQAVSRYRSQLLASTPDAPESMVHGQTVDEVDESFAKAKELVEKVRRGVEERMAQGRLPAWVASQDRRRLLLAISPRENSQSPVAGVGEKSRICRLRYIVRLQTEGILHSALYTLELGCQSCGTPAPFCLCGAKVYTLLVPISIIGSEGKFRDGVRRECDEPKIGNYT